MSYFYNAVILTLQWNVVCPDTFGPENISGLLRFRIIENKYCNNVKFRSRRFSSWLRGFRINVVWIIKTSLCILNLLQEFLFLAF